MNISSFENLKLKPGEEVLVEKEGSEQFTGQYYGEYDDSNLTFKFSNYSNGQTEILKIEELQQLKRL